MRISDWSSDVCSSDLLKVLLVEKDDLAQHTSSASSKLIHGGLRYLEYYEFRLVREALKEREILLQTAPHIVRPLSFVLPHARGMRPWSSEERRVGKERVSTCRSRWATSH